MQDGLCERPELVVYTRTDRFIGTQGLLSWHDIYVVQFTLAQSLCLRDTNSVLSVSVVLIMGLGKAKSWLFLFFTKREKQKVNTQLLQINNVPFY